MGTILRGVRACISTVQNTFGRPRFREGKRRVSEEFGPSKILLDGRMCVHEHHVVSARHTKKFRRLWAIRRRCHSTITFSVASWKLGPHLSEGGSSPLKETRMVYEFSKCSKTRTHFLLRVRVQVVSGLSRSGYYQVNQGLVSDFKLNGHITIITRFKAAHKLASRPKTPMEWLDPLACINS